MIMGVDVEQGEAKVFRGIVGEMIAYVHKIPLFMNGKKVETRVAFALSEVTIVSGKSYQRFVEVVGNHLVTSPWRG